ncbi:MAG: gliding motility-associated C-terminal domain-containing protein [Bacteroidota bacterium]
MKRKAILRIFLSIAFLAAAKKSDTQNLVPNYSFEVYSSCPTNAAEIYKAIPWFQPSIANGNIYNSSSSEYFHSCNLTIVGVPLNFAGRQIAFAGQGYAGIVLYAGNNREYIEVKLIDSLIAGKTYCLSFYISLAESSEWGIDMIGGYLANDSVLTSVITYIPVIPQVENATSNTITDTSGWVLISGSFIAQGGEKFLTIGNFRDNSNTQLTPMNPQFPSGYAYYYIDDVSLICCDSSGTCALPEDTLSIPNVFSPNYDGINDLFEIKGLQPGDKVQIYNRWGTLVFETEHENAFWDGYTTSGELCQNGVYFYTVVLKSGEIRKGYLTLIR